MLDVQSEKFVSRYEPFMLKSDILANKLIQKAQIYFRHFLNFSECIQRLETIQKPGVSVAVLTYADHGHS